MARSSIGNPENTQYHISLQDAVAYMIPNPRDLQFMTNEHPLAESLLGSQRNNDSRRAEEQRRPHFQGEKQNETNEITQQQSSRRNDNLRQQPYECRDTESRQHLSVGQERIRTDLSENEINSAVGSELQCDSIDNPSDSVDLTPLSSRANFMTDSFHLPAGSHIKSPQYQTFNNRLRTFNNWPKHLPQTPRELAHAGFYSLGKADIVRCFSCDGGLKNWEPEDDPWIEHARWFPECDYLRHVKGEEFIQLVRHMDEDSEAEDEQTSINEEEKTANFMQALNLDDKSVDPCVLDADCAQSVIQTGFSPMVVARAINDLLIQGSEEFGSQDILTVILDKEEEGLVPQQAPQSLPAKSSRINVSSNETDDGMPILEENENLKRKMLCTECGDHERNVLFLPCKHLTVCENCSPHIYVCFTCFRRVRQKVKTYPS